LWAGAITRSSSFRYGFAFALSLLGLIGASVLLSLDETPFYALLIGCVAVSIWYGGLGPGLVTMTSCWAAGYIVFLGEPGEIDIGTRDERLRWGLSLLVALGVVWVAALLHSGRTRATTAVTAAQETIRDVAALQDLAAASSAALTQTDVANALIERIPTLLGARGGAVGLVDGNELVIVDPRTGIGLSHQPGARIPLSARAPIAQAAATGEPIVVHDRATFERLYPDGIALTDYARARAPGRRRPQRAVPPPRRRESSLARRRRGS